MVIAALELTHFYDLPELFQACIAVVKIHIEELEAHDDWSVLQDLGLVEKVLEACQSEDSKPPEDIDYTPEDEDDYYRLPEMLEILSQDLQPLYKAVVDSNPGFFADVVKITD